MSSTLLDWVKKNRPKDLKTERQYSSTIHFNKKTQKNGQ